ncbi:MAG: hypothetical protein IK017_11310 [Paludibacteraceae bacterium]|nr:hypothetical protein [Paludibacteraceae bacterium]MBR5973225.1 hypothetical protein [Paludibacteraceae bacterium]
MKKIMILLLLCTASLGTYAQEKGDKVLSAMIGVNVSKSNSVQINHNEKEKSESDPLVQMSAGVGIHGFVAKNFRLGFELQGSYSNNINNIVDMKSKQIGMGPTLAYYVPICEKFYYVPQFGAYFVHLKYSYPKVIYGQDEAGLNLYAEGVDLKYNGFAFCLVPAQFEIRPNQRIGLAMSLFNISLVHMIQKNEDEYSSSEYKYNNFEFDFGFRPSAEVHIYF